MKKRQNSILHQRKLMKLPAITSPQKRIQTENNEIRSPVRQQSNFIRNLKKAQSIMISCKFQKKRKSVIQSCIARSFRVKQDHSAGQSAPILSMLQQIISKKHSKDKIKTKTQKNQLNRRRNTDKTQIDFFLRSQKLSNSIENRISHFFPLNPIKKKSDQLNNNNKQKQPSNGLNNQRLEQRSINNSVIQSNKNSVIQSRNSSMINTQNIHYCHPQTTPNTDNLKLPTSVKKSVMNMHKCDRLRYKTNKSVHKNKNIDIIHAHNNNKQMNSVDVVVMNDDISQWHTYVAQDSELVHQYQYSLNWQSKYLQCKYNKETVKQTNIQINQLINEQK